MIPDAELVRRSLSHGSHHFGVLIQRHSNYLFALAMRMTKGQHALAEDVVQQSFLNAFSRLKSFDRKRDFRGWLTGISVNCYRDMLRKSPPFDELEVAAPATLEPVDEDRAFVELITPLSAEQRILFILRFVYEYKVEEIAALLEIKSGTVKSKLSRAMSELRAAHNDCELVLPVIEEGGPGASHE